MFNPFAVFDPGFISGFQQKGVKAFVKQTYERGRNPLEPLRLPSYLLIHADDVGLAQEHYDAIKHDPNRELFVLSDPSHVAAVQKLVSSKAARCYTILTTRDANKKAKKLFDKHIRAYVNNKTNWNPKNWEDVIFGLDFIYGEVYAKLKYGAFEIKFKLEELENQRYVL